MRYLPPNFCGTISLEPLVSSKAGDPAYLSKRLTATQRAEYSANLKAVRAQFTKLDWEIPEKRRIAFILRSIDNVQKDIS